MENDVAQITVADVVKEAVALVDPHGTDPACRALELAYEDDDRPAVGVIDTLREELASTVEDGLDPEQDDAPVEVAAAVAFFLATKPRGGSNDEATIREAVRVRWHDDVPENVSDWLEAQGVDA